MVYSLLWVLRRIYIINRISRMVPYLSVQVPNNHILSPYYWVLRVYIEPFGGDLVGEALSGDH